MITPRDIQILQTIYNLGRLSREQIRRLLFHKELDGKSGLVSIQAVDLRLKLLTEAGYLSRVGLPVAKGSGQFLYTLGPIGVKLLTKQFKLPGRAFSKSTITPSFLALDHNLEVVDFYIGLKEALEQAGGGILSWVGERHSSYRFSDHGRPRMISPDGYCLWGLNETEGSFFLEWERGNQPLTVIADKLDTYNAYYASQLYLAQFGDQGLTPRLILVVPDERRKSQFLTFLAHNQARWLSLPTVLIGVQPQVMAGPLGQVWSRPDGVVPATLFE